MARVELDSVSRRFGNQTAVDALTLVVHDREFLALLGPSGCGKSTTMNLLAGIDSPDAGAVRFDGRDMARVPARRRRVGFVFQNYAIFGHLSVRDNLSFGLRMAGRPPAEILQRTGAMARLLELEGRLDEKAGRIGTNAMQRLAIGRAAVLEPAVFLLDEPLSNLDAAFRARMRTELKLLQRAQHQTMIYVTHDQLEAMSMADRIAVMSQGRLQQVGTPLEVYNAPANRFVARFIGSPPMNLLPARVASSGGRPGLSLGGVRWSAEDVPAVASILATCEAARATDVLVGIRPEAVTIESAGACGAGLRMPMRIDQVERIGARSLLRLDPSPAPICEDAPFIVQVSGAAAARAGDAVTAVLDAARVVVFDATSGRRLGHPVEVH